MKVDKKRQSFSSLFLAFVLVIVVTSFSYESNARLVPLVVGFLTLALAVLVIINEINPISLIKKLNIDLTEKYRSPEPTAHKEEMISQQRFFVFLFWIIGFVLCIFMVGFHISIAMFTFAFLKVEAKASWLKALLGAGIVWAAVFIIFELAMGFNLFKGWFFGEILPPV